MRYKVFEELPVWQAAVELAVAVCRLTDAIDRRPAGWRDQIERAALSISNNIAEGFDRGTHEELISFLYIALGSAAEVRSMLYIVERLSAEPELQDQAGKLRDSCRSISRQLGAWLEALKVSDDRGPRHRSEKTREAAELARRQQEMDAFIKQAQADAVARMKESFKRPPDSNPT